MSRVVRVLITAMVMGLSHQAGALAQTPTPQCQAELAVYEELRPLTTIESVKAFLSAKMKAYGYQINFARLKDRAHSSAWYHAAWRDITPKSLEDLKTFAALFIVSWSNYPPDFITATKLRQILLVANLYVDKTYRRAMPANEEHALYFDIVRRLNFCDPASEAVLHHEYFHFIEQELESGLSKGLLRSWTKMNPPDFTRYRGGGPMAYVDPNYANHERDVVPGFITYYSTYSALEDRAEVFAHLVTPEYRDVFYQRAQTDSYLAMKLSAILKFIQAIRAHGAR